MFKKAISRRAILMPIIMLTFMWLGFALQSLGVFQNCFGAIMPLVPDGLFGIFLSPFLHGDLNHIFSNSVPMAALLFLLYQFYPKLAHKIFFWGWISVGFLVWLLPPINLFGNKDFISCIIGASGIVYVLAFFLFFSGVFRWDMKLLAVSLAVALYYGSLIWGIFPEEFFTNLEQPSKISWQSHLSGAVVGTFLAFIFKDKTEEKKKKYIWQFPNYYNEKDDKLWQEYREKHPEDFQELPQLKKSDVWEHLDEIRKR